MQLSDVFRRELDAETATTRRVLERVPQAHLGWRPHPKSMTLGQLARHIAGIPGGVAEGVAQPVFQLPSFPTPSVEDVRELLPILEKSVARAHEVLGSLDDAAMECTWRLVDGDREVLAIP